MATCLAVLLALGGLALGPRQPGVAVIASIALSQGRAGVLAADPTTNRVFVAEEDAPAIAVFDGSTYERLSTVPTAGYHSGVAVDSSAHRAYWVQSFEHRLKVIDGTSLVGTDLPVPGLVNAMGAATVDPVGRRLFVARNDNGDVAMFDTSTQAFLGATCPGCCAPACVAAVFDPASRRAFLANPETGQVVAIRSPGGELVARITVGNGPHDLAVNSRAGRLYVSPTSVRQVAVVDVAPGSRTENVVVKAIAVPETTNGIALDPERNRVYVTHTGAGAITVVDGVREQAVATLPVCDQPLAPAVLPRLGQVFVTCVAEGRVVVLEDRSPMRP